MVGLVAGATVTTACDDSTSDTSSSGDGGSGGTTSSGTGGSSTSTSTGTGGGDVCPGATLCNGVCVNTDYDPNNCGDCDVVCDPGQVCSQGACGMNCGGGTTQCGDLCIDTENNPDHCGGCDEPCGAGQLCSSGVCLSECGGGLTKCGDTCVNTDTSEDHCGGCNQPCSQGEDCVSGSCIICDTNTTDCDGDGWLVGDGDCCDKSGSCGLEPELVNPGAIEVVGNGIDDNCNGLTDLFDTEDTIPCDQNLTSNTTDPVHFANALGICRQTQENPSQLQDKTWGLIDAQILRADGSPIGDHEAHSIRPAFGNVNPGALEGTRIVVLSSGIAADGSQTNPGPNGGAPGGSNVTTTHSPSSAANIGTCSSPLCINDWFATANPPLKNANELPVAPNCGSGSAGTPGTANDSIMLYFKLRAPTNAKAFSFNSYFFSAEYPEYVCTNYNDQFIALVDTPVPAAPIPNPLDKNLLTYNDGTSKWPIGINIAAGTSLFSVCESSSANPSCWDTSVSNASCTLGPAQLTGTGFEHASNNCLIGGGTFWLTTSGNVVPGDILELRIVVWDVGDTAFDSLALLDGFEWLSNATLPGTD
ncbi:MAG: choice-of-anchor L domain-containing protein [Deltaproteobacteria bacterium]|nr:choice-of-anchor L domain-containing protein [Deltaproteobacteria bacterium]